MVQRMEGVLLGKNKEWVIVLVVTRSQNYTQNAIDQATRARVSSGYTIILTDEHNVYSALMAHIVSNRFDSSDIYQEGDERVGLLCRRELQEGNEYMWLSREGVLLEGDLEREWERQLFYLFIYFSYLNCQFFLQIAVTF